MATTNNADQIIAVIKGRNIDSAVTEWKHGRTCLYFHGVEVAWLLHHSGQPGRITLSSKVTGTRHQINKGGATAAKEIIEDEIIDLWMSV